MSMGAFGAFCLALGLGMAQVNVLPVRVCVQPIPVRGKHVRFSAEDHVKILLAGRRGEVAYRDWEQASRDLAGNWFDGDKQVQVAYVKSNMPRAMLLELRFPKDKESMVDQESLKRLLETEAAYYKAEDRDGQQKFYNDLMQRYGIGPGLSFDADMGGATPQAGCAKYDLETPKGGIL